MQKTKTVVITGGAGNIAYSLAFRVASGEIFGNDQPVSLVLVEVEPCMQALKGVELELLDCAFPLLESITLTSSIHKAVECCDFVLFIGSKPRSKGMERSDLLESNGMIFKEAGQALERVHKSPPISLVIGNPCNTNCLVLSSNAPSVRKENFFAMTRLDLNRTIAQVAQRMSCSARDVSRVALWGNHSSTQVPDITSALVKGVPIGAASRVMQQALQPIVQTRGAAIIEARGKSSAASAAQAIIDSVADISEHKKTCAAVYSENNPYGIDQDLFYSFPIQHTASGFEFDTSFEPSEQVLKQMKLSEKELISERDLVKHLL